MNQQTLYHFIESNTNCLPGEQSAFILNALNKPPNTQIDNTILNEYVNTYINSNPTLKYLYDNPSPIATSTFISAEIMPPYVEEEEEDDIAQQLEEGLKDTNEEEEEVETEADEHPLEQEEEEGGGEERDEEGGLEEMEKYDDDDWEEVEDGNRGDEEEEEDGINRDMSALTIHPASIGTSACINTPVSSLYKQILEKKKRINACKKDGYKYPKQLELLHHLQKTFRV